MTSDADRRLLLQVARDAIVAHVAGTSLAMRPATGLLEWPGAAFVTIHNRGELRGCIGHIDANEPLGRVIARCAVAACSSDPRFPPIAAAELPQLDLELSLLGSLEPIGGPVATEWKWDAETFLAHTCHKAGLPRDAWKQGAKLWRFEAEVFSER